MQFSKGDRVKVEYRFREFFTGVVLWTENYGGLYWVTVRPDEPKFVSTFGSAHDMGNGYKSYIAGDPILGKVFPVES